MAAMNFVELYAHVRTVLNLKAVSSEVVPPLSEAVLKAADDREQSAIISVLEHVHDACTAVLAASSVQPVGDLKTAFIASPSRAWKAFCEELSKYGVLYV